MIAHYSVSRLRQMKWEGLVAHKGERRNVYWIIVVKS